MAYIGKAPNTAIVNQATSQSFSGNGSTTAFTLTRSVNVGEDLEVFVNNVQQEPGSGKSYTASGTTLTFDEAPPSGTNNIYVIYRGEATINPRLEHDANAALAATTGTFTGDLTVDTNTLKVDSTNNRVGIGDATPDDTLTIYGGTAKLRVGSTDSNHVRIGRNTSTGHFEMMRTTTGATDQVFFKAVEANNGNVVLQENGGNVGINTSAFENTNGTEFNIKGGTNNTKPAVITMQGASGDGAGFVQTEVFGIASVSSATEITRITGTGANGMRMLIYVTVTGHTGSLDNGHNIGRYYWNGGTNSVVTIEQDVNANGNSPSVTFDTSTSNVCIVKLTSGNGSGSFNGVMEVKWYVPIDFAGSTWTVS